MSTGGPLDDNWRDQVVRRAARVGSGATVLVYSMVAYQEATGWTSFAPHLHALIVLFGVVLAVVGWAPGLPTPLRIGLLSAPGLVICGLLYISVGYPPGVVLASVVAVVLVVALSRLQPVRIAMALVAPLMLAGVGVLVDLGTVTPDPAPTDPGRLGSWVRVGVGFVAITLFMVSIIDGVLARLQQSVAAQRATFAQMQTALREREVALAEKRQAEHELFESHKLDAVGRLASGLAHEYNNELLVVLAWADHLKRVPPDAPEFTQSLDRILEAAGESAQITRALLLLSTPATDDTASCVPSEVVGGAVTLLKQLVPDDVDAHTSVEATPPVGLSSGHVVQVLLAIVLAALERAGSFATMRIDISPVGSDVRITVSHDGAPLDAAAKAQLMEPLLSSEGRPRLGLAAAREVLSGAGGALTIESGSTGATYTARLPKLRPSDASAAADATGARDTTVLLIEGDPAVRRVLGALLRAAQMEVLPAADARAGLELARRHRGRIDVVCVDDGVEGVAPPELIARVRELFPAVLSLLLTQGTGASAAMDAGALAKPFTGFELVDRVRSLVHGGQS